MKWKAPTDFSNIYITEVISFHVVWGYWHLLHYISNQYQLIIECGGKGSYLMLFTRSSPNSISVTQAIVLIFFVWSKKNEFRRLNLRFRTFVPCFSPLVWFPVKNTVSTFICQTAQCIGLISHVSSQSYTMSKHMWIKWSLSNQFLLTNIFFFPFIFC